jgi:hypothetical protein
MADKKGSVSKGPAVTDLLAAGGSKMAQPGAPSTLQGDVGKIAATAGQTLSQMPYGVPGPVPAQPGDSSNVVSGPGGPSGGFPAAGESGDGSNMGLWTKLRKEGQTASAGPRGDYSKGWTGQMNGGG